MGKNRMVNTRFWSDSYSSNLDPVEKLLFIYLLTNERSTLAGIYELPLKIMAVETGIESEMVRKILNRFEKDGKVIFRDGWVVITNFIKHHENGSPTVKKGMDEAIKSAPQWAKDIILKGIDTVSPSALASTSTSNSEFEIRVVNATEEEKPKSRAKYPNANEVFRLFPNPQKQWEINTTERKHAQLLYDEKGLEEISDALKWYQKRADKDFMYKIDTPYDLSTKWVKLERLLDEEKKS